MLDAAIAIVGRTGLSVSFDHISLEEVIHEAGVARSAVYRRWPYKDLFFSDLLRELAGASKLAGVVDEGGAEALVKRILLEHLDWLDSAERRHDLAVEIVRQGALRDFDSVLQSTEWRTYIALNATFLGLPDGDLRREVQAALGASERGFNERIARSTRLLASLLGYRVRSESGTSFEAIARLGSAAMTGHVINALSVPEVLLRFEANPFGASQSAEWSLPAIGLASNLWAFLEPDPQIEWTGERIAWIRAVLESGDG